MALGFPQYTGDSSNKTLTIIPPKKYKPEASSLLVMLPQHYVMLVAGPDTVAIDNSRKRLASTMAASGVAWETVVEYVEKCFNLNKLRHVATVEEALAEIDKAKRYYAASQLGL